MKTIKRLSAALIAVLLCAMILVPTTAFAATTYTPVAGGTTSFNKYLVVPAGVKAPNVTFSYTVAAAEGKTASNNGMEVLPGVSPASVTVTSTTFAPSDTLSDTATEAQIDVARTDRENVKFETSKGEKFAVKQATVSFAAVSFTEPGIYRYVISETASEPNAARGIFHDDDADRILDVYVTDNGSGTLVVTSYVLHKDDATVALGENNGSADVANAGDPVDDKTDGFTNEYKPTNLSFKKEVTGNQASRDKVFAFTLKLGNLTIDDQFVVSIADDGDANTVDGYADPTSTNNDATIADNAGKENAQLLTAVAVSESSTVGKVEQTFYLQHGQSIAVRGLPLDATYEVTENAEDYKSTAAGVNGYADATSGTMSVDVKTSYLNTRSGVVPTGVMLTVVPGVAIVAIALFGLVSLKRKKNEA